jgi:TRAP transporter TAXI family solute receptor
MKKCLGFVLAISVVSSLAFFSCSKKQTEGSAKTETVYLKFPTAGTGGAVYSVGAALANIWNEKIPNVQVAAEASNGGVQNLNLASQKDAQLGVAVTSIITQQKNGEASFQGHAYDGVRILTALYSNYNQVIVSGSSGIDSFADIRGKRFAPGAPGATTEVETKAHFEAAGYNYPDDIRASFVDFATAAENIRNKQLDGAWVQAGLPTSAVTEICTTANGKLISIDDTTIKALQARYPWYNRAIIPAGTYPNQSADVVTTSLTITVFIDQSVSADTAYELAKTLWDNLDTLKLSHPAVKDMSIDGAAKNLGGLPLHPGAEKFYKEKGVL